MSSDILCQVRRHLRGQWRASFAVMIGLTLATACSSAICAHFAAVSFRELQQTLAGSTAVQRTLLIVGDRFAFGEPLLQDLRSSLGDSLDQRMVIRQAVLRSDAPAAAQYGDDGVHTALVDLQSIDQMASRVRVVQGILPRQAHMSAAVGSWPPPMEVVIGARAADSLGLSVGDRVTASGRFHRLDIVGIVEPVDHQADIWGGDLRVFGICPEQQEPDCDRDVIPLLIAPNSMQAYLGAPIFPFEVSWRITVSQGQLDLAEAARLRDALLSFQARSAASGARTMTDLLPLLDSALNRIQGLRTMTVWLLVQAVLVAVVTLAPVMAFACNRVRADMIARLDRGASMWGTYRSLILGQAMLIIPPGLLLGPILGLLVCWIRGALPDRSTALAIPGEAWVVSAIVTGLSWAMLVIPLLLAARRRTQGLLPQRDSELLVLLIHRRFLDVYLLAFAAILTWQLQRSGTFLMSRLGSTEIADPLLLFGPTLLVLALATVLLRVVPLLAMLAARTYQDRRGWLGSLSFVRLARDRRLASQSLLSLALSTGVVLTAPSLTRVLRLVQQDTLAQGAIILLRLGSVSIVLLAGGMFTIVRWLEAQSRQRETTVMRSLGVTRKQLRAGLLVEGVTIVVPALSTGVVIGFCLYKLAVPHQVLALSRALPKLADRLAVLSQFVPSQWTAATPFNWPIVTILCAILLGVYVTCALLASLLGSLPSRPQEHAWDDP